MNQQEKKALSITACKVRMGVIEGTYHAKSGHPGGSLSLADIFTYLYFKEMNIDPKDPKNPDRDRFVLSKGHTAPGLYATLANRGYFPVEDLKTLRHIGSYLQGHPNMNTTPGVDMSTGSLGQGVSIAAGMALGAKYENKNLRVYTAAGDGEIQEGQIWEALMFAAHYKLDNLTVLLDHNGLQIDGTNDEVMGVGDMMAKYEAFGFACVKVDGHDIGAVVEAVNTPHPGKPLFVCCETHKGHGVSFMEDQVGWHGKAPNKEQYEQAMKELGVSDNG